MSLLFEPHPRSKHRETEDIARMERVAAVAADRRKTARDMYRKSSSALDRRLCRLSEMGFGVAALVHAGAHPDTAKLLVLGEMPERRA